MSIVIFEAGCQSSSNRRKFGLCDNPPPSTDHAYIDERNGENWIASVDNHYEEKVVFTGIDHCIIFPLQPDGTMHKRCDGVLTWSTTVAFVELKQRGTNGSQWVKDAEQQLRVTIDKFEGTPEADLFPVKKAYIANSSRPRFRESQAVRMEKFARDTKYILRIEARIVIT